MKLLLATALLVVLPNPVEGASCGFTRNFGDGNALSTSGLEGFNVAGGATTTCTLSCNSGAATTLWLKYDRRPGLFDHDGSSYDADGCSATISISSGNDEYRLGYQVNSATYTQMSLSCGCSSVGPDDPGDGGGGPCFSETATVLTKDHGAVAMKDLEVGTQVVVGHDASRKPIYEPVYSFGHIHETNEADFVRLFTNLTPSAPLEISESHLIYQLQEGQVKPTAVRADSIKVHDVLLHNGAPVQVNRIERVARKGLYQPMTPSGTIVVNALKASAYVSNQDWAPTVVQTFAAFGMSEQMVFHWYVAPYRFFCIGLSSQFCGKRSTVSGEEGILNYLLQGKKLAEFGERFGPIAHVFLFGPPLAVFFGTFRLLEYPFGPSMAPFLLATILGLSWYIKTNRQQMKWTKKTV